MLKLENFSKAYVEVLKILKEVRKQDLDKIPQSFFNVLEKNKDINYVFSIDIEKPFEEQKIMRETKAILAYIFINYWSNATQKQKIMQKFKEDIKKAEQLKQQQYSEDVFKYIKVNQEKANINNNVEEMQLVVYQKEKFFNKVFNKIKKYFQKINKLV